VTPTCRRYFPQPSRRTGLPWSDCIRGATTTTRASRSGLRAFSPDELRESSRVLLDWLIGTGCSRVAVHFDVDTIDSNEIVLGLGAEPNGLTSAQVRRIVADIDQAADVVGFIIAEFIPRQVMHLQQILKDLPLIDGSQVRLDRVSR
jgi:arginase family enzyme